VELGTREPTVVGPLKIANLIPGVIIGPAEHIPPFPFLLIMVADSS